MTSARITGAAPGEGAHLLEPPPSRTLFPAQRGPSPLLKRGRGLSVFSLSVLAPL
ncbi:hypothetical protein IB211_00885c [Intestinimonas butyriciproducens]|uniref:Uncharacterized protein n=1 Tax=Intestinimonas butyriciproducens TaxID=1297617 RepID=A0A0S2W1Z5_9FIRM|nr:hypothetical protein IB211_00885c [Intestinimonas butyriciproducens]QBB66562.1 hypothetical protein SRB521_02303 [Intestinimonas butyriciproducens]